MYKIRLDKFKCIFRIVFGAVSKEKLKYTLLYSVFLISLTSATIAIRDIHNFQVFSFHLTFTVGVIFFPLTFVVSNLIQEEYDITAANTVVFSALITDLGLVLMLYFISHYGDSFFYRKVFTPLPYIWLISFISILISCFCNNLIFKKIRPYFNKGFRGILGSIFASSSSAELILPVLAMPFLFIGEHSVHIFSAIFLALIYKLIFTGIASFGIAAIKGFIQFRMEKQSYDEIYAYDNTRSNSSQKLDA